MSDNQATLIGRTMGQYEIIEKIGAGGMATVYKAHQAGLDRDVAIKVLPAQHALSPGFKERFLREARTVAQLHHPNILPVYDLGIDGDLSYFVMQYVASGRTVRSLQGQPLDFNQIANLLDQMAAALDYAHDQGVLHRDVKPENMLLEGDWLLLGDFGLAKITAGGAGLTASGVIIGTPSYISPEQVKGDRVDHRSDIYSLGVVLYEMITGQVPYRSESSIATMFKHVHEPLPSPRIHLPSLPEGLERILVKALAKDPRERYYRAGDVARAYREEISNDSAAPTLVIKKPEGTARVFISYKHDMTDDETLANYLDAYLADQGFEVFTDKNLRAGDDWLQTIDEHIRDSDFFIVLLSEEAAYSEMVQSEVRRAHEHRKRQGAPKMLPIRINYDDLLPYAIDAFLDPVQYANWTCADDTERVAQEIFKVIGENLPTQDPVPTRPSTGKYSEDGRVLIHSDSIHPPLPEFDPRLLDALEAPGGVVKLRDKFYIERQADNLLQREITKLGTTTTIRASRQTGKSSLLVRGVNHAKKNGSQVVTIDLQRMDTDRLTSPDLFLRDFAETVVRKLRLDASEVNQFWGGSLGPQDKLTYLMEDYVLPEIDGPIVLALDEVDRLLSLPFSTDFFGLLRSWHNSRALDEAWDNLNLVMVISTEPYMLIADVNQSPFNVGLKIYLDDFDEEQVFNLNHRHGSPVDEMDFPDFVKLLGGHPYLTRNALYSMVSENLSWADLQQSATQENGPFGDHLRRHFWLLRDEPELKTAFKQVVQSETSSDEMALFRLLQSGLVKGSGDAYTCRCELYRMYFRDKL